MTGGGEWGEVTSRVALYNIFTDSGFVADLPHLNIGRQDHGCGYYYEEDTLVVIRRCVDMSFSRLHGLRYAGAPGDGGQQGQPRPGLHRGPGGRCVLGLEAGGPAALGQEGAEGGLAQQQDPRDR